MEIAAQISVYPLRQSRLAPTVNRAVEILETHGLEVRRGAMSSVVGGDHELVFTTLEQAFREVSAETEVVMVVTLSNVAAEPPEPPGEEGIEVPR